jgi:hypothetical protein
MIKACVHTFAGNKLRPENEDTNTFAAWTALVIMAVSIESKGQEPDFKPP